MALTYTVKVVAGPGTSGYEHMTEKQRKVLRPWATFAIGSDAHDYASSLCKLHPCWRVCVVRREYGKDVVDYRVINEAQAKQINARMYPYSPIATNL